MTTARHLVLSISASYLSSAFLAYLYPLPPLPYPYISRSFTSIVRPSRTKRNKLFSFSLSPSPISYNQLWVQHSFEEGRGGGRRGREREREEGESDYLPGWQQRQPRLTFLPTSILPSASRLHIEPSPNHDRGRSSVSSLTLPPILDLVELSIQSVQTVSSSSTSAIILHHHHHLLGDTTPILLPKGNRTWMETGRDCHRLPPSFSSSFSFTLSTAGRIIATQMIVQTIQHLVVCSTRARTLLSATRKVAATVLSRGSGRGYVTLIAGLDVPDGADTTSLFIHWPVSWFTLRGLLMSWGLVPTGLRCGGGGCTGWLLCGCWLAGLGRGGGGTGGVRGQGHGLARLEGDCNTSEGLARLDNADRPPGLLRDSSSSGVPASPTLPRLSSEWSSSPSPSASPSPSPPSPMYLIHFFLRLRTSNSRLVFGVTFGSRQGCVRFVWLRKINFWRALNVVLLSFFLSFLKLRRDEIFNRKCVSLVRTTFEASQWKVTSRIIIPTKRACGHSWS